jgi:glycosyltransferase involved in cell wall biosynthesis
MRINVMRIGFNITDLIPGKIGGMESYMRTLIHYSPLLFPNDEFYIFVKKEVWETFSSEDQAKVIAIFITWNTREQLSEKLQNEIINNSIDLWLSTLLILDPLDIKMPKAFTIPDMQHEYYPEFFTKEILEWRRKNYKLSADTADIIFTISEDSKKDIIKFLKVDPKKVIVTYLDAPPWFYNKLQLKQVSNVKIKYKLPEKYIFYPANTWQHKNHIRLFEALKILKDKGLNINLVLTGYSSDSDHNVRKAINQMGLKKNINHLGYVKREDMPYIYRNATMLVFPSLFEGFGIPVLEAMRSECPVVCSGRTSIPEIGGDSVLYFNSKNSNDIAEKIKTVYEDKCLRVELAKKGIKQAEKFSYEKCCKITVESLKRLIYEPLTDPLISIIIPSYNQGKFIEKTIQSILHQDYDNYEIIIMDGGSNDETIDTIRKYAEKYPKLLTWESKKDKGQSHAINKGLFISKGEILAYLNSDDTYEKRAFSKVINFFSENPSEYFVYGIGHHIDINSQYIEDYPNAPADKENLYHTCPISQPTVFWRRKVLSEVGYFSENLHFAMDYDYWIRISSKFKLNYIKEHLANTRFYSDTKTSGQALKAHAEILDVVKENYGQVSDKWVYAYANIYLKDKQKFQQEGKVRVLLFRIMLILVCSYIFLKYNFKIPFSAMKKFKEWL